MAQARCFLIAALSAVPLAASPASAQGNPRAGVIEVYGNDPCPTDADGNEIVVCRRLDESERFRLPKSLREFEVTPENESWAIQQDAGVNATRSGIDSCSTVGVGGQTGCYGRQADQWRARRRAKERAEAGLPVED